MQRHLFFLKVSPDPFIAMALTPAPNGDSPSPSLPLDHDAPHPCPSPSRGEGKRERVIYDGGYEVRGVYLSRGKKGEGA
jgi:hypothetical protein